ncbi:hypothetical protein [Peredibacter starrii]|uniref:DUF4397 domain-containing protein n=1 Tax=Peredibacter starrii TaxID=28202 RepID=A0AAX4HQY0_9BACT|nr:hypothetical protein [Peredibacter starrii]WPU65684.1 hypothetical protein SOO65_02895 [Peredibacter starrii]
MRIGLFLLFVLLVSCAEAPLRRNPASESPVQLGEVSRSHSSVQLFPSAENDSLTYYFYLQLKDSKGQFVDVSPSEIALKAKNKRPVKFKLERILNGRYYVIVEKSEHAKSVDFVVQNQTLKEKVSLNFRQPDRRYSSISIKTKGEGKITFQLRLADKSNRPVLLPDQPEIVLEGRGEIEDLKHIQEGIWQFTVIYPEDNQIMYFSVRAQGVYLVNLLRYQHIEK